MARGGRPFSSAAHLGSEYRSCPAALTCLMLFAAPVVAGDCEAFV